MLQNLCSGKLKSLSMGKVSKGIASGVEFEWDPGGSKKATGEQVAAKLRAVVLE